MKLRREEEEVVVCRRKVELRSLPVSALLELLLLEAILAILELVFAVWRTTSCRIYCVVVVHRERTKGKDNVYMEAT